MIEQLFEAMTTALSFPAKHMAMAHNLCQTYRAANGAGLQKNDRIRCLFSVGPRSGFEYDAFKFVEGLVYDVTGTPETDRDRFEEHLKAHKADQETIDKILNHDPDRFYYLVSRPGQIGEVLITYPGYPGVILDAVMADAVDESQATGLKKGDKFTPEHLTVLASDMTLGKTYEVSEVAFTGCDCDDPQCPAQNICVINFIDDAGEVVETQLPFGPMGTLRLID